MQKFEIVSDAGRLEQVAAEWDSLWSRSRANVFQHLAWIRAWQASDGASACGLNIGLAWNNTELTAVLPMVIRRWNGLRVLEWAAQANSDYCDGFGHPDAIGRLMETVIGAGEFDLLRLKNIRVDAIAYPFLKNRLPSGISNERCLGVRSMWTNGQSWFATLNKKKRNNHRRGFRILKESGEVSFRVLRPNEPWKVIVSVLANLKRRWLAANNLRSPLLEENAFTPLVSALHRIGCLRIFVLECGGTLAAGSVNAIHHDQLLAFFAAYDSAFERSSPGILLMNECTKWAFDHDITYIDYLRGEEPYKFEFANDAVDLVHVSDGRTLMGKSAILAHQILTARRATPTSHLVGTAYCTANGTPRAAAAISGEPLPDQ